MKDRSKYLYIVVEGNIGAGKTSLTKVLCHYLGAKGIYEKFVDNPFLPLFYENPDKYAFQLELSFLVERYNQFKKELGASLFHESIIADYYLKKSLVFASETLSDIDFQLYSRIFSSMLGDLPKPDLYIYLHQTPKNLLRNIAVRGRTYESNIGTDYLERIQHSYFRFFKQVDDFPVVVVNCEKIDFVNNVGDAAVFQGILKSNFRNGLTVLDDEMLDALKNR